MTSSLSPRLLTASAPKSPAGIALLLHGGASRSGNPMVSPTQPSVIRMIPIAHRVARAGRGRLAVFRLLNSHRGWDQTQTPLTDTRWALTRLRDRYPELPVCLIGHSLGGRTALLSGAEPGVSGVIALNAWVYPTDSANLRGRRVLMVHGTEDRIAPIQNARTVARRLSSTADVEFVTVEGGRHAMLRHGR